MGENNIFSNLTTFPFISTSASVLNDDYMYNRSGGKIPAPIVFAMLGDNDALSSNDVASLAAIITAKYGYKWGTMWSELSNGKALENIDFSVVDSESASHASTEMSERVGTRASSDGKTTYRTGGYTESNSTVGSDTSTSTRDESRRDSATGTGSTIESANTSGATNVFGFNSVNAVPEGTTSATDGTTQTNATTDTTDVKGQIKNSDARASTTSAVKKFTRDADTDSQTGYGSESTTGSVSGEKSGSSTTAGTHVTKGQDYRRDNKVLAIQTLFQLPEFINFIEIIYDDMDEVLTTPVFA